jgi:hypothetical protein
MKPTASYLKVPYDLRAAKQMERRMLVETFQVLNSIGFQIDKYQYTGFGSIYFVDFILFHRLLGISKMLSVEFDQRIKNRVRFNRPFRCVDIQMAKVSDVIPTLSPARNHILWLDYDAPLQREHLEDIWLSAARLSRRSILLVTVDVEPPVDPGGPRQWRDYFRTEAQDYLGTANTLGAFARSNLILLNRDVIIRAIESGLSSRDLTYIPLFCFSYADGHEMLTVGGLLGTEDDAEQIQRPLVQRLSYLRLGKDDSPKRIVVPRLTRKERIYMDKAMPSPSGWRPKHFELPDEYVEAYRDTYRFFPMYAELLL